MALRLAGLVVLAWAGVAMAQTPVAPVAPVTPATAAAAGEPTSMEGANGPTTEDAAKAPMTTLTLGTRLVGVAAVVRDKKGAPVKDLTAADFTLKEDGKPVAIRYLSQGSDLPLTLALLVDTSGSQRDYIADETQASKAFFPLMLTRPEDRAVLVQFDTNVLQLHPMTNSVADLTRALGHLSEPHRAAAGGGGTLLYDAIYATAHSVLRTEKGRRAMVLLTDGGDNGSRTSLQQAVGEALKQDVVVYSVFYSENSPHGDGGKKVLDDISNFTGGKVFVVSKKTPLETIYAQIAEDMRLQYQLAYTPPESPVGSYHNIELKPTDKKLVVEARRGYYTQKAVSPSTGTATASK